MSSSRVVLESSTASAAFDLAAGGRLASFVIEGRELLVAEEPNPMGWGSYPMVPWAGRVADGRFTFDGVTHQLPITLEPHAIHGTGYLSPWELVEHSSSGVAMQLDLIEPWPLGGHVAQRAKLTDEQLHIELEVTATSAAMPAMAGWHPWFRREIEDCERPLDLRFGPAQVWEMDDRAIPTGALVDPPPSPWDHCFTNLEAEPVLRWGDTLELRLSSNCTEWMIYTPDHAVCVEPQTSAPNSFNRSPDVIEPGESLTATFSLRWSQGR